VEPRGDAACIRARAFGHAALNSNGPREHVGEPEFAAGPGRPAATRFASQAKAVSLVR